MNRTLTDPKSSVVLVADGETDAGCQLACDLLDQGRRVAVIARHAHDAVRVMHGRSADRVMVIAADTADPRQWDRVTARVRQRFGRLDAVVRASDAALRASA
jgi:NAD(P)-dependent dehydrogenase (short-subunit alcohol dehydrogenase family)